MGSNPTPQASCPSRWRSLVCKILIAWLGLSETNTIGYLNTRTLKVLLRKNGLQVKAIGYLDDSDAYTYKRSVKKRIFDMIEKLFRLLTPKFMGGLVVVASYDNS